MESHYVAHMTETGLSLLAQAILLPQYTELTTQVYTTMLNSALNILNIFSSQQDNKREAGCDGLDQI